jgi:hypothetical protein
LEKRRGVVDPLPSLEENGAPQRPLGSQCRQGRFQLGFQPSRTRTSSDTGRNSKWTQPSTSLSHSAGMACSFVRSVGAGNRTEEPIMSCASSMELVLSPSCKVSHPSGCSKFFREHLPSIFIDRCHRPKPAGLARHRTWHWLAEAAKDHCSIVGAGFRR